MDSIELLESQDGASSNITLTLMQHNRKVSMKPLAYHRDIFNREFQGRRGDCYLDPKDGRLSDLVVQSAPDVLHLNSGASWGRIRVRNRSPLLIRLSYWINKHIPDRRRPSYDDTFIALAKWFPACMGLTLTVIEISHIESERLIRWSSSFCQPRSRLHRGATANTNHSSM